MREDICTDRSIVALILSFVSKLWYKHNLFRRVVECCGLSLVGETCVCVCHAILLPLLDDDNNIIHIVHFMAAFFCRPTTKSPEWYVV